MWSGEVVELLPLGQFGLQVDFTRVAEKLVELLLIRSVGSFDLAVKLRRAGLDVGVADAFILDMPMEFRLELMILCGGCFPHLGSNETTLTHSTPSGGGIHRISSVHTIALEEAPLGDCCAIACWPMDRRRRPRF